MSTTPEPGASLTARQRATAKADQLILEYETILDRPGVVGSLLAIAYLDGEQAGSDATIAVLRRELSKL